MTIDKQVLRQIAESVDREEWYVLDNGDADYQVIVSGSLERGATYRSYQPVTNEISNKKIAAFIAAFNPKVALALLNEVEAAEHTAAVDHEAACSLVEENETLKRRIAEQREYYEGVIADGSKRIAETNQRNTVLTAKIEPMDRRIAELEARTVNLSKLSVGEVMHMSGFSRDYAEGWCAGNDNAIHEIRTAGIKVKG
ncbi:TPA: ead/Ea22-like family protein [Salmonella enterica subsp. enterica serovar Newport]